MKNIVVAGGTGFIGKHLVKELELAGHHVVVLSRSKYSNTNVVHWDPENNVFPVQELNSTQVLINLCGAGIADKRWSKSRKAELASSRIGVTQSLLELGRQLPNLEHYLSASGINAYGFDDGTVLHSEEDHFGKDYVSQLVKDWEVAADLFAELVPVTKLRIAIVLARDGGAMEKMKLPLKFGVKGVMGSGQQYMPWVHVKDLTSMFRFLIENKLAGVYNTNAGNCTNNELMTELKKQMNKKTWWNSIPAFVLKLALGEASDIVLKGACASNQKIKNEGFTFRYNQLDKALQDIC